MLREKCKMYNRSRKNKPFLHNRSKCARFDVEIKTFSRADKIWPIRHFLLACHGPIIPAAIIYAIQGRSSVKMYGGDNHKKLITIKITFIKNIFIYIHKNIFKIKIKN